MATHTADGWVRFEDALVAHTPDLRTAVNFDLQTYTPSDEFRSVKTKDFILIEEEVVDNFHLPEMALVAHTPDLRTAVNFDLETYTPIKLWYLWQFELADIATGTLQRWQAVLPRMGW